MPTITSAQSGPSNVGSTWVGGVVPGSLFQGTRTTTGVAVALGATSIPVLTGSQIVTAGRWIRVSGDARWYRVTTGLAANTAGNIVIDAPGLMQAIPASATVVSVNMIEDKVIVAHPGTNSLNSPPSYFLSASLPAGSTSIPVINGSGSIVAGECIQFRHSIALDEDGVDIYDNTYYRVSVGVTAPGTITITPGLAYPMAANTRIVNCGHVVELVADHVWGDDTSSTTPSLNGIEVRGTLLASRSVSQTLVARGTLFYGPGASIDYGVHGVDPIPDNVRAVIRINDSLSLSSGKHALTSHNSIAPTFKACGKFRTRNTRLSAPSLANANTITVDDSTGWVIGDLLVIASPGIVSSQFQVVTITGGSSPNWTVSSITLARNTGCFVGNLSSNVEISAYSQNTPGPVSFINASGSTLESILRLRNVRFANIGSSVGWVGISNTPPYWSSFGIQAAAAPRVAARWCATHATTASGSSGAAPSGFGTDLVPPKLTGWAVLANPSALGMYTAESSSCSYEDFVIYQCDTAFNSSFSAGGDGARVKNCFAFANARLFNFSPGTDVVIEGGEYKTGSTLVAGVGSGSITLNDVSIQAPSGARVIAPIQQGSKGRIICNNPTFSGGIELDMSQFLVVFSGENQDAILVKINGVDSQNARLNAMRTVFSDSIVRFRSRYSSRIRPRHANRDIAYNFKINAVAGVSQNIKGSIRFDENYTTSFPPSISMSGQGVSVVFTCPAVSGVWHAFEFAFTPSSSGEIDARLLLRTPGTNGFVWLDGVYHFPMIQSARHFGRQWVSQASQPFDNRITFSESAALALPAVINHVAQTITVQLPMTPREVFEKCIADLCQTENLDYSVHITSETGETFATTYSVVFTGTGAITGPYTDSTGLRINITAPAIVNNSRVQLFNVTDGAQLLNTVIGSGGLLFPLAYPGSDKVIRLRAESASKLPLEVAGVLTSTGLSFLDIQSDDTVYTDNAIDGSTVTEFVADLPNIQVDVSDPDGVTSVKRLYAWAQHYQTTEAGIASTFFGAIAAVDAANYVIDQSKANILLDNVSAFPVRVVDGYLSRRDGSTVIAPASGSIQMDPGKAYVTGLSNPIVLSPGERLVTLQSGEYFARS